MFHPADPRSAGDGELLDGPSIFGGDGPTRLVAERHLNHFNVYATPDARRTAEWHNRMQQLAESTRLGIPVTISSDPRHAFDENPATSWAAGSFSQWPEPIGLAATRRRGARARLRRDRPAGVPRRRHPRRAPPDGRRRHRAAVGAHLGHVRRGLRSGRPADRGLHPRLPGRRARPRQRRVHDEALPRRRTAGRRRGPALPVRQGSGVPGRTLRGPPAAVRVGVRRRNGADHAVLRPSRSAPSSSPSASATTAASSPTCCAAASASTASSAPTGGSSATCRCPTARSGRRRRGAWRSSTPPTGWRRSSRPAATSSAASRCPSCSSSSSAPGRISESRIDESARRILRDKFRLGLFDDPYVDPEAAERLCGSDDVPRGRRRGAAPLDRAARERRRPSARCRRAHLRRRAPGVGGRGLRRGRRRPGRRRRGDRVPPRAVRASHRDVHRVGLPRREPRVPGRRARPRARGGARRPDDLRRLPRPAGGADRDRRGVRRGSSAPSARAPRRSSTSSSAASRRPASSRSSCRRHRTRPTGRCPTCRATPSGRCSRSGTASRTRTSASRAARSPACRARGCRSGRARP